MVSDKAYTSLTAEEAAILIPNGAMVAVSGFTPAGATGDLLATDSAVPLDGAAWAHLSRASGTSSDQNTALQREPRARGPDLA